MPRKIKKGPKPKKFYAIYKGDDILMVGTAEECAEYMGVTITTVRWMSTEASHKRYFASLAKGNGKDSLMVFKVEDEEETE